MKVPVIVFPIKNSPTIDGAREFWGGCCPLITNSATIGNSREGVLQILAHVIKDQIKDTRSRLGLENVPWELHQVEID